MHKKRTLRNNKTTKDKTEYNKMKLLLILKSGDELNFWIFSRIIAFSFGFSLLHSASYTKSFEKIFSANKMKIKKINHFKTEMNEKTKENYKSLLENRKSFILGSTIFFFYFSPPSSHFISFSSIYFILFYSFTLWFK